MARKLENFVNVDLTNPGDYPFGRIKNNDGTGNGTPFAEETYGDLWQFFRKLLYEAGIAPNNLPDNVTNGLQLWQAATKLWYQRAFPTMPVFDASSSYISEAGRFPSIIRIPAISGAGTLSLAAGIENLNSVIFRNETASGVALNLLAGWTVEGSASYNLPAASTVQLVADLPNTDWLIVSKI